MMGRKWTLEERKASSERAKAAIAAKNAQQEDAPAQESAVAVVEVPFDGQCIYCSLEFKSKDNLFRHQSAMHGGEMPQQDQDLPPGADKMPAGSTLRMTNTDGTVGIPLKNHWPKKMLEEGWECDDPGDRIENQGGWRYIPEDPDDLDPRCHRCGGPMHKLSQMIWYEAQPNDAPVVVFQGLTYHIARDEKNHIPDIIAGQLIQARNGTKAAQLPSANTVQEGQAGKLAATGFLEPLEEEATTA